MKASTILTALGGMLAFNAQAVNADCYGSGDPWPNKDQAAQFVWDACYKPDGMFAGQFSPRKTKSMCPRIGSVGLLFEVENQWDGQTLDLNNDDCYTRLKNEIYGCDRGGESTKSKWRFRADPGNC
ncbi:septin [Fusarium beomiforme]|uniref:Septin n=1 Tax=Fusarium beomiforme TaxID=44412 RepID=A0A9P5AL60_9HYPO|nr:septin [Fusarium beomiforme]